MYIIILYIIIIIYYILLLLYTIYLTYIYILDKAKLMYHFHMVATGGGGGETCIQLNTKIPVGTHVLTIVPTHEKGKKLNTSSQL